jgi:hypothetical protein
VGTEFALPNAATYNAGMNITEAPEFTAKITIRTKLGRGNSAGFPTDT